MKRTIFSLALAGMACAPAIVLAAPGEMSVSTFLEKADTLQKKGAMAVFSSDLKLLKSETRSAANFYRERIKIDKAAGRAPQSCPPQGEASLDSKAWLAHLRSYPVSARPGTNLRTAFSDLMKKRYPCK